MSSEELPGAVLGVCKKKKIVNDGCDNKVILTDRWKERTGILIFLKKL
jgi:hypothetical protein